jgi:Protein of unknown function (DUF3047)
MLRWRIAVARLVILSSALVSIAAGTEPLVAQSVAALLADPARMLSTGERIDFVGSSRLSVERTQRGLCLRSTPQHSATGLYQRVELPPERLSKVAWNWRVDRTQPSADIRRLDREDFAAKIAFVFGEPSLFNRDVPTIAYVWTSTPLPNGSIITSKRHSKLRYFQLHGPADAGRWQHEQRNIVEDFKKTFGYTPGPAHYVAVFNDNDQTGEPVSALFGPIMALK